MEREKIGSRRMAPSGLKAKEKTMPVRKRSTKRKPARDIAQEITDKLIARLEEGGPLPWRRPWQSSALAMPLRSTGEAYKGINNLLLHIETACNGYASPYWMTFRQAKELGGSVRKGERSSTVIYYGTAPKKGDAVAEGGDGAEGGMYRFLKGYAVFNASQIDGLPEHFHPILSPVDTGVRMEDRLQGIVDRMPFAVEHGYEHAAYREHGDRIVMPDPSRFESVEAHAATLLHEMQHATGIESRLNRECFARYHADEEQRAEEELVAEIGAMQLGARLGMAGEHIDNHAAYVGGWLRRLKSDKRFIFKAAAAAQTGCDWLLDRAGVAEYRAPVLPEREDDVRDAA